MYFLNRLYQRTTITYPAVYIAVCISWQSKDDGEGRFVVVSEPSISIKVLLPLPPSSRPPPRFPRFPMLSHSSDPATEPLPSPLRSHTYPTHQDPRNPNDSVISGRLLEAFLFHRRPCCKVISLVPPFSRPPPLRNPEFESIAPEEERTVAEKDRWKFLTRLVQHQEWANNGQKLNDEKRVFDDGSSGAGLNFVQPDRNDNILSGDNDETKERKLARNKFEELINVSISFLFFLF